MDGGNEEKLSASSLAFINQIKKLCNRKYLQGRCNKLENDWLFKSNEPIKLNLFDTLQYTRQ